MKKIFAILISLLFIASILGVASIMAPPSCNCGEDNILLPTKVSPGQEFIVKYKKECTLYLILTADSKNAMGVYINSAGAPYPEGDYNVYPYVALKPGTIYFCNGECSTCCPPGSSPSSCYECETLTIAPKEYPMQQFMKILGFGKEN